MIDSFKDEYAFLSNFYPSPIKVQLDNKTSMIAPTAEHLFQFMKTSSIEEGIAILSAPTPGEAKRLGRKCFLLKDWKNVRDKVMYEILVEKFTIPELKEKLLATGDEYLEEGNYWHDNYWGNCHCEKCADITGQNKLGILLMKIREDIRNGSI